MDIKEQIGKVVDEVSKNPNIKNQFEKESKAAGILKGVFK